jgi:HK97 family phage major capsid protein
MEAHNIFQIQRRTLDEIAGQISQVKRTQSFSLRELINSKLKHPLWMINDRAVAAASELSEACRQRSGEAPSGTWVPLAALSRDLTATGNPQLITGGVSNTLQAALTTESVVMGGATILSGLSSGNFTLPSIATPIAAGAGWCDDNAVAAALQPTLKAPQLIAKSLVVEIDVTRRLMMNSSVDLEAELRLELLRRMMFAIDTSAIAGTNTYEPSGMLYNADLQILSAGTNGAAPTWANMVELEYQVSQRVGSMRNPAMLLSPALRKKLRTTQRAAGLDFILNADSNTLMGHPLRVSSAMPDTLTKGTSTGNCSAMIFGDLSEVYVGFWGPLALDIMVDGYTRSSSGNIRIIGHAQVGVTVRHAGAFAAFKDLLAA